MKLKTLLLTTALVASQAFADAPAPAAKKHANHSDDYYAKIEAGVTMPERIRVSNNSTRIRTRNGFVGGLGAGYQISEFFRTDLMLQFREIRSRRRGTDTMTARADAFTAMLNGYVDGHNDTIFTPYLMAGVGAGRVNVRLSNGTISGRARSTTFAWNLGAGAQAKVSDQVSVDLGYRYVNLGKPGRVRNLNQRLRRDLRSNEVVAGLIWQF